MTPNWGNRTNATTSKTVFLSRIMAIVSNTQLLHHRKKCVLHTTTRSLWYPKTVERRKGLLETETTLSGGLRVRLPGALLFKTEPKHRKVANGNHRTEILKMSKNHYPVELCDGTEWPFLGIAARRSNRKTFNSMFAVWIGTNLGFIMHAGFSSAIPVTNMRLKYPTNNDSCLKAD